MESPPRNQVFTAEDVAKLRKTPGSVKKMMKRLVHVGSSKKRRLDRDEKLSKRHKPSNEFNEIVVSKAVPRKMHGATKMLTEMALNSPKIANDKIKKVKSAIVGTPMKMAGMMKRSKSLYSRTPKGETKAVDEWNRRISMVRKDAPSESHQASDMLWSDSEWAKLYPDLSVKETRLQEVFNEFILKELSYTESITQIRLVYMKAFSTCDFSQFDETREEIAEDLFANINEIVDLQESFAGALVELRSQSNGLIRQFGNFFTEWLGKFSPYVPYCAHIGAMKRRYDSLLDKSEDFARLVKQLQLLEKCGKKDLWTLLDEPRRHFLRYNLTLKSALVVLKKIHAERAEDEVDVADMDNKDIISLTEALNVVNQMGEVMNKGVDVISDYLTMRSLRSNLIFTNEDERNGFQIPEDSVLLFHGLLTNRDGKGIHVFLGSHYLVFTRESRRGGKTTYQVPRNMKPVSVKDLDVRLVELNDPGAINFGRQGSIVGRNRMSSAKKMCDEYLSMMHVIDHKDQTIHTLKARSQEGRDAWVHAIREVGVVANVKSKSGATTANRTLKRVKLVDLSALPSPTLATTEERQPPAAAAAASASSPPPEVPEGATPGKCFKLSEGTDEFLHLRSKLQFSENTPHVTPPRQSVRDTIVAEDDTAIRKFDFATDAGTGTATVQPAVHGQDVVQKHEQAEERNRSAAASQESSGAAALVATGHGDDVAPAPTTASASSAGAVVTHAAHETAVHVEGETRPLVGEDDCQWTTL